MAKKNRTPIPSRGGNREPLGQNEFRCRSVHGLDNAFDQSDNRKHQVVSPLELGGANRSDSRHKMEMTSLMLMGDQSRDTFGFCWSLIVTRLSQRGGANRGRTLRVVALGLNFLPTAMPLLAMLPFTRHGRLSVPRPTPGVPFRFARLASAKPL